MIDIANCTTGQLLAYFNTNSGKPPVKKFATLDAARKRVAALLALPTGANETNAALAAGKAIAAAAFTATNPKDTPMTDVSAAEAPEQRARKPAAKKAAKKAAAPKEAMTPEQRSKAVAKSWEAPDVAAARACRYNIKASGTLYRSMNAAFTELGLPMGRYIAFRTALVKGGVPVVFEHEGRKLKFEAILVEKDE